MGAHHSSKKKSTGSSSSLRMNSPEYRKGSDEERKKQDGRGKTKDFKRKGFFPLTDLPDDLLTEVLLRVPAYELVSSCVFVCQKWNQIVNLQSLWKEKCRQDYYYTEEMLVNSPGDFKELYFKNPYNSNLVKNPYAEKGFDHWKIVVNGGNGFQIEPNPIGSHPVENFADCDIVGPVGCWSASYNPCYKEQTIDLIDRGFHPEILDNVRPDISVSEWYAARFDCGCQYKCKVYLLCEDLNILNSYEFSDTKQDGRDWFSDQCDVTHWADYRPAMTIAVDLVRKATKPTNNQTHWAEVGDAKLADFNFTSFTLVTIFKWSFVFSNYLPGCRYIKIKHGGQDTKWWAGNFGVKITLSSVRFDFSHTAGPFEGEYKLPSQEDTGFF